MKITLAIPTHLKTVPMGRFYEQALRELSHEVALFDFCATHGDGRHVQQRAYGEHTYRHRMASLLEHMGVPVPVQ